MRKLFILFFCLICALGNAQVVNTGKFFDNWYVTGNVGTTVWDTNRSWAKPNDVLVNVGIGKELTPVFGLELDVMAGLNQGNKTLFDSHNITGNVTVNALNLLFGYKKRVFEPVVLLGGGWYHTYSNVVNRISAHAAIRGNFNVSDRLALSVTPEYVAVPTPLKQQVNVYAGVVYKFSKNRFPTEKLYDYAEVEYLNNQVNALRAERDSLIAVPAKIEERIVEVEKEVVKTEFLVPKIQFVQNSSTIHATSQTLICELAAHISDTGLNYIIDGFASEEGDSSYNRELSLARAEAVKKALIEYGAPEDKLTTNGNGATTQFGDREFNRVVVILVR